MSYQDVVEMRDSYTLKSRITACAALEGVADPENWTYQRGWTMSSRLGWQEAWSQARSQGIEEVDRGRSDTVITDAMILDAVQAIVASEA